MQNLTNCFELYCTAHTWSKWLVRRGSRQVAWPSVMMGIERIVGHWARHLLLSGGSCSSCRLRRAAVWACRRRGAVAPDAAVGSVGRRQRGRLLLPRPGAWVAGRSCVGSAGGVVLFQPQDLGSAKHTPETEVLCSIQPRTAEPIIAVKGWRDWIRNQREYNITDFPLIFLFVSCFASRNTSNNIVLIVHHIYQLYFPWW